MNGTDRGKYIKCAEGLAKVKAFVKKTGYPVIAKPDNGVGASGTYKLHDDAELDAWFNEQGLAWDPAHDMDGDSHTARDEYAAGTDPWDVTDFLRITEAGFEEGLFTLYVNGEAPLSHYSVEESEDLAQGTWSQAQGYGPIQRINCTNVWTQATQPANAAPSRFFRVKAVIPAE